MANGCNTRAWSGAILQLIRKRERHTGGTLVETRLEVRNGEILQSWKTEAYGQATDSERDSVD